MARVTRHHESITFRSCGSQKALGGRGLEMQASGESGRRGESCSGGGRGRGRAVRGGRREENVGLGVEEVVCGVEASL